MITIRKRSFQFNIVQSAVPLPEIEQQIRKAALILNEEVARVGQVFHEATRLASHQLNEATHRLNVPFDGRVRLADVLKSGENTPD